MTTPIEEIKIRARLLSKALIRSDENAVSLAQAICKRQRWAIPPSWTLAHCLNIVSAEAGFEQWEHARRVLGGEAHAGEDLGKLWYADACAALTNLWFAQYSEARACLQQEGNCYLLPYARQFIVVDADFIRLIGLSANSAHWENMGRDAIAGYGKPAWQALVMERLVSMRGHQLQR